MTRRSQPNSPPHYFWPQWLLSTKRWVCDHLDRMRNGEIGLGFQGKKMLTFIFEGFKMIGCWVLEFLLHSFPPLDPGRSDLLLSRFLWSFCFSLLKNLHGHGNRIRCALSGLCSEQGKLLMTVVLWAQTCRLCKTPSLSGYNWDERESARTHYSS